MGWLKDTGKYSNIYFIFVVVADIQVYCSGNNLVIIQDSITLLQTIYLASDGISVTMDPEKGLIAASFGPDVVIFEPTRYFDKPPKVSDLFDF